MRAWIARHAVGATYATVAAALVLQEASAGHTWIWGTTGDGDEGEGGSGSGSGGGDAARADFGLR